MKMFRLALVLSLFILFINVIAFGQPRRTGAKTSPAGSQKTTDPSPQEIAESGSFDGKTYKNELLGFRISIPKGWTFASEDTNRTTLAAGRLKIKVNETAERQKAMDKSIANTRILFQTSPLPLGQPGNSAIFVCGFEKLSVPQTQEAYAEFNKKLVLTSMNASLKKDLYSKMVNGIRFTAFDVETAKNDLTINQTYMITHRKNMIFFFVLTLADNIHEKTMADALSTLRLDK